MDAVKFRMELLEAQSSLQQFAYKLTGDKEDANDLLQETSLKALSNMDKYVPDTNFKGWLFTIMRNIFINSYRRVVREQTFVDHSDNLYLLNQSEVDMDYIVENGYDFKEIKRAIASLSYDMQQPFVMHISGYKYREIADKLKLPIGTVKSRIFLTRRVLQEELKDFI